MRFVKNILLLLALCCNNIECMTYNEANEALDNLIDSVFGNNTNNTQVNYIDSIKALGKLDNSFHQEDLDYFLKEVLPNSRENKDQLCKLFVNLLKCNSQTPDIINEKFTDLFSVLLEFIKPNYDYYSSIREKYDKLSDDMKLLGSIIHYLLFTDKADLNTRITNTTNLLLTDFPRKEINEEANVKYYDPDLFSTDGIAENSHLSIDDRYKRAAYNRDIERNNIAAPNKKFTKKVRDTFNTIFSDAHKWDRNLFSTPTINLSKIFFNESDWNGDYIAQNYINTLVNFSDTWNTLKNKLNSIDFTKFLQSYVLLVNKLYLNNKCSSPFQLSKYFIEDNTFRYVTTDKIKKYCTENLSNKELSNEDINNVYKKLSIIKCPSNITRLLQRLSSNSNLTPQQKINIDRLIANIDNLNNSNNNTKTLVEKYTKELVSYFSRAQQLNSLDLRKIYNDFIITADKIVDIYNDPFSINPKTLDEHSEKYKDLSKFIMTHEKKSKYDDAKHYILNSYCTNENERNDSKKTGIKLLENIKDTDKYYDVDYFKAKVLKNIKDSDNLTELFYTILANTNTTYGVQTWAGLNIIWKYYANNLKNEKQEFKDYTILDWIWPDNKFKLLTQIVNLFLQNPERAETIINNLKEINDKNDEEATSKLNQYLNDIWYDDFVNNIILPEIETQKESIPNKIMSIKKEDKKRDSKYDWILNIYDYPNDLIFRMKESVAKEAITIKDWNDMVYEIKNYKLLDVIKKFIGTANVFYKVYEYNNKVKK